MPWPPPPPHEPARHPFQQLWDFLGNLTVAYCPSVAYPRVDFDSVMRDTIINGG